MINDWGSGIIMHCSLSMIDDIIFNSIIKYEYYWLDYYDKIEDYKDLVQIGFGFKWLFGD